MIRSGLLEDDLVLEPPAGSDSAAVAPRDGEPRDRFLILVTPDPFTDMLIRRGRRVADYLEADCFVVAVMNCDDRKGISPEQRAAIEKHLN